MKLIIHGHVTLIDKKQYNRFKDMTFSIRKGWAETPYVTVGGKSLSRLIMDTPDGIIADHKNHNTLDNRRINLRNVTRAQNMWNRKRTTGVSKYKGVYWSEERKRWVAEIYLNNKRYKRKRAKCEKEAARHYNKWAKQLFGEYACLNKI